jgi:hypothetical protein
MSAYSNYLGSKRCCDLRGLGPQGRPGITGPQGDKGNLGPQGVTGTQGFQGSTGVGCRGFQGYQGPPGGVVVSGQSAAVGPQGPQGLQGVTGVSSTTSTIDAVLGYGNISTNRTQVFTDSTSSKSLTASSTEILLNDATNSESASLKSTSLSFTTNTSTTTISNTGVNDLTVQSSNQLNLNSSDNTNMNTGVGINLIAGDSIQMTATNDINLTSNNGNITLDSFKNVNIGDLNSGGNGQFISVSNVYQNIELNANNGLKIIRSTIQYPVAYSFTNQSLTVASSYAYTFCGSSLTATLPQVTSGNVGIQFLITNTHATSMTVTSSNSQSIYSSTAPDTTTGRSLASGASHIFTAIKTISGLTYGWSMV